MSSELAMKIENLSKCYHVYGSPGDRLKQFILPKLQRTIGLQSQQFYREFWALQDISFEVKKGETVGIIGRNGSGKSTLLQLICGTLNPTGGTVQTNGRIAALLELGSGFNPEFTGRENVYLSCALLGLSKAEIDARFDDIAAFADIGRFIEQPVKTYSSGMFVRLAFAVNIVSQPDIMIVDEALAVGDMHFQAKCMTALSRIQDNGATILFVSHNVGAVKSLCKQAVYLEHGKVVTTGSAPVVAERYVRAMRDEMTSEVRKFSSVSAEFSGEVQDVVATQTDLVSKTNSVGLKSVTSEEFKRSDEFDRRAAALRYGSGGISISYAELVDLDGNILPIVAFNQEVRIVIYVEAKISQKVTVNFNIRDDKKINIVGCGFTQAGHDYLYMNAGDCHRIEYTLKIPLQEGNYSVRTQISSPVVTGKSAEYLDVVDDAIVFRVESWEKAVIWSKVHLFPELNISMISGQVGL